MDQELQICQNLALKAGGIMLKYFEKGMKQHLKSDMSIVTNADEEINALVIREIRKNYPHHSILGEEESSLKKSDYVWLCDPIDGTHPYAKGLPVAVFSLALVEKGVPLLGVVYDPFTKRLYGGSKSKGAYLNDRKIRVSQTDLGSEATVNVEWWPEAEYDIDTLRLSPLSRPQNDDFKILFSPPFLSLVND